MFKLFSKIFGKMFAGRILLGKTSGGLGYRYLLKCEKCGFQQDYELTFSRPDNAPESSTAKLVDKLPSRCPKCGGKLKELKLRVWITAVRGKFSR